MWYNLAEHTAKAVARHRACLKQIAAAADQPQPPPEPVAVVPAVPEAESRVAARMRDEHATVQALYARGMGLRAIARELGLDRKTVRRFAHATTSDEAVDARYWRYVRYSFERTPSEVRCRSWPGPS